ncbi:MAG: type II 3-dehydroquinate dehydratase [Methylococcaceae bacterium]
MTTISVINGPNLNMLGIREPGLYGNQRLTDIQETLESITDDLGHRLFFYQSNAENEIIDTIHANYEQGVKVIIINPAAYTHTSIAIRDAFLATKIPFIEVHLSNIHSRETFRSHSYLSDIAQGVISGFGPLGYELALQAAIKTCRDLDPNGH